ncbi:MAG: hypothetical protein RRB22_11415, partial [Gammaproteobacteria bacterium]|nr:hypothetical protein [Gammaproteobacteria bacterium]
AWNDMGRANALEKLRIQVLVKLGCGRFSTENHSDISAREKSGIPEVFWWKYASNLIFSSSFKESSFTAFEKLCISM